MRFIKASIFTEILLLWRFSFLLYAHSEVAGIQFGVWSFKGSPYVVKGHILIPKGLVLKIEEGVVVKFTGNYYFKVEGGLIASGNKANPIVFTSIFDNEFGRLQLGRTKIPQQAEWEGIEFLEYCDDYLTVLNYCIIRYSKWGIRCSNAYPLLTNVTFVDNDFSSLKINDQDYPFEECLSISPISEQNRPGIAPLPEPIQETDLDTAIRLRRLQQQKAEQHRLKALQDSIRKAQKIKPTFSQTGQIFFDREIFDQLNMQSINEFISYFPGFFNLATIWSGSQITSRGIPPTLSNNRLLFLVNGVPFYEPIAKTSYLEFIPFDAIERVEICRGISLSPFNHHGVVGSVNFVPRFSSSDQISKSKIELGTFGTKKLTAFLGLNRNSTFLSLSSKFKNSAGYWRTFSQDESGVNFRQKYATDIYNFSLFIKRPSLSAFASYFEQNQDQLGLVPLKQYAGPIYRRGLVCSLNKEVLINPRIRVNFIGNYVENYERLNVGSLGPDGLGELSKENYSISKGNILSIAILSQYRTESYLTSAGLTMSRLLVKPLFEIKNETDAQSQLENWSNSTKISDYESSGFIKVSYNLSPFIGVEGNTFINFSNSFNRPDISVDAKIIYNPFLPFDSYLRYSRTIRSATLIERKIYLPDLFYGNNQLKPEEFEQWEWSTDIHPFQDWTLGFIIFSSKNNHLIKMNSFYQFANIEQRFETTGYEFLIQGKINDTFSQLTNMSYYYIKSSGWLYPKLKIDALASIHWLRNFSTTITFQYLSQIKTQIDMGPYYLTHLTLTYHLFPRIKISVNGFDLLDQCPVNPEYIRGIISAIPEGAGRSFYITMTIE